MIILVYLTIILVIVLIGRLYKSPKLATKLFIALSIGIIIGIGVSNIYPKNILDNSKKTNVTIQNNTASPINNVACDTALITTKINSGNKYCLGKEVVFSNNNSIIKNVVKQHETVLKNKGPTLYDTS